ncbi:MAG: hypothetical protein N2504_07140 [candidate division WOR-3 bacterium]|nr:hypothetical protein [candidate division WOR-3 bacterium]
MIKDEGKAGDRDFLQWDTVAMLSLLGVHTIPAYYCWAESMGEKLTKQRFEYEYISGKLEELASYKHDALHWNLHRERGIEEYLEEINKNLENFISRSRYRAKKAQGRETKKAPIDVCNYLGGVYHFTVDEVEFKDDHIYLIECKHSKGGVLPSVDDVKDGLLKVMLYKSIDRLELDGRPVSFKIALKLTSLKNKGSLKEAILTLRSERKRDFYYKLLEESQKNQFEVLYYGYS